jgi:DNA-binding response OmpR family regulator
MLNDKAVLIVEDNLYLSIDLSAAVEEMNGRVVGPVCSAAEAHLILDAEHVSAAILDCELADSQVTSVARRLVEKNVPYVIHTGTEVPAELTLLRPDAPVLMKPIQPMHVIAILAAHAERSGNKR